ncbi:hypothetical protein [Orlajensenia leifsoniae]|uniref:Uncharacterized protein n=1 Tax=Orlajensenia leifsoniae TaxID=2561933 RepID=A0A4Y9R992_9MICO|nr:hypothetical protein [Leifsonia flava]TFV99936.1 hypothetical protein E4M00_01690 [Leifsonia flava]
MDQPGRRSADGKKLIKRLIADDRKVASAGKDTMTAVAASAPTVIGGYASARNTARDALNRSAERLGWTEWPAAETELASYVTAVGELKSSQDAELAEKSGSLLDTRLAAEEYARSIAGGVMLDFDWADIVIGYGWGDSMAGTAEGTWYSPSEVYSMITLTNTVASLWNNGSGWSQALVAHEVGHAIHPKCFDVYPNDAATEEQWATAWSISMGPHRRCDRCAGIRLSRRLHHRGGRSLPLTAAERTTRPTPKSRARRRWISEGSGDSPALATSA